MAEPRFLCAMGLFDEDTNQRFEGLRECLREKGFKPDELPPHVTFGIYTDLDEDKLLNWVQKFSESHQQFSLNFNHIGLFGTNVCFLAPRVTKELLTFHEEFHAEYDAFCGELGNNYSLRSENWVPHATITMGEEETKMASSISRCFEPFHGRVTRMMVCAFYPIQELRTYALQ